MPTFVMGDQQIEGSYTAEEALELLTRLAGMEEAREQARTLRDVRHFHVFGRDRQCACGLAEVDYMENQRADDENICPLARAQAVQSPADFLEQLMRTWRKRAVAGPGDTRKGYPVPHSLAADTRREYLYKDTQRYGEAINSMIHGYESDIHF